jgi:hypothetical protein
MLAFAGNALVSYGPSSATDQRPVLAYDTTSGVGTVVADQVNTGRVVHGTEGPLLAVMRLDPDQPSGFEITATDLRTGVSQRAYVHDGPEVGPMLASLDRTNIGTETPPDWVFLADSFLPFVEDGGLAPKSPSLSSYPMLLNLRTKESVQFGPFRDSGG